MQPAETAAQEGGPVRVPARAPHPLLVGSASLALRLASLAGKLALSLYMARLFPLAELGRYGLAFSAVMLAVAVFGFRLDYVFTREILGLDERRARSINTSISVIFLLSFVAAGPVALGAMWMFRDDPAALLVIPLIYVLCCGESYANYLYIVTTALKWPTLANALFFVRSGLWTVPAIAVSYFVPELRTVAFVLWVWIAGTGLSLLLNLWYLRRQLLVKLRWSEIEWGLMRRYARYSLPVWIGSLGIAVGTYVDRFVLASYLTLEDVGVATFYISLTAAALTLVQSATTNVAVPGLIEHYDAGRSREFRQDLRRAALSAGALSGVILLALAGSMPLLSRLTGRPELMAAYPAFIFLLFAAWVRTHSESAYLPLFVERRHRAIWLGNLLFPVCAIVCNLVLVPRYGLLGLGVAALLSALAIVCWRLAYVVTRARDLSPER